MDSASPRLTMVCEARVVFFPRSQLLGLLLIKYFNVSTQNGSLCCDVAQCLCKMCLTSDVLDKKKNPHTLKNVHFLAIILFSEVFADKMSGCYEISQIIEVDRMLTISDVLICSYLRYSFKAD